MAIVTREVMSVVYRTKKPNQKQVRIERELTLNWMPRNFGGEVLEAKRAQVQYRETK